jgi:23S rRNA (cytosine1962-C5)-methyltransferase
MNIDARFDHKNRWQYYREPFEEWSCNLSDITLILRLQRNGQVGFFPEHIIIQSILDLEAPNSSLLNLFAYTGLASVLAVQRGMNVTHVDTNKQVLSWVNTNMAANNNRLAEQKDRSMLAGSFRVILEDAITFINREIRRKHTYDVIIADPPSFSRQIKNQEQQEGVDLLQECFKLLPYLMKQGSVAIVSSHQLAFGVEGLANLALDAFGDKISLQPLDLLITESNSPRRLKCGVGVVIRVN